MKKGRIIKTIKKIDKKQIIAVLILLLVATLSIGYSAFSSKLSIEGAIAEVRIKKDVRVTGVKVSNLNASAGGISLYEEYGVDFIEGKIELPKEDTKVIYDVSITNIGNVDIGILELNNLPDNLEYKILNYNLKDKICNESGTCKLGITKDIQIEIGYKEGMYNVENTTFDFKLNFNFQQFYTITYTNLEDVTNYPKEVLGGDTLVVEGITKNINVLQKGIAKEFIYTEGALTVENVEGNLEIIKKDFILALGQTFNKTIKQLSTGNSSDTYSTNNSVITKIEFLTDSKLPEGYTKESLQALKSSDVSVNQDEAIMAYYDDNGTIYIYCDGIIQASTDSGYLFNSLSRLTSIEGLDKLDTTQVTNMQNMFSNCSKLTNLEVSEWDTSKVTNMYSMFLICSSLTSLDLSKFNTSAVTNMSSMFNNCSSLTALDLSNFNTSNVTNMDYMFSECEKLTGLDLSKFNTSKVTNMSGMFNNCSSLTALDLSNFNTSNVTNMGYMFSGCEKLTSLDLSKFNTSKATNMFAMFRWCNSLMNVNLSNFDTGKVTDMGAMFYQCRNLISLDLSNFDTSRVTDMSSMFRECSKLTALDLNNFDTSKVVNMSYMFNQCNKLINLNISSFNTNNIKYMNYMFSNCSSLTNLDLSSFNTSAALNMSYMFSHCSSLTNLDLSSFNTSAASNMSYMFFSCSNLTNIDLRNAIFSQVRSYMGMFPNEVTVIVKDTTAKSWITSKFSNVNAVIYSA